MNAQTNVIDLNSRRMARNEEHAEAVFVSLLDKAIDENSDLVQPITASEMNSMQSLYDDILKIEEEAKAEELQEG
ncbi:hypothetical protein [Oceanospirillum maris]|uniref:hypothetical protein n=1 Tax=Oceanospirillum maris TaxID=64977 RepID=UPI0003F846F9|nr:hypothetical protein [Oceanospirillum maris]